ncbi:MAG: DUF4132 domain-containing protein [Planctomycetaceae bacterium]
MGLEQLLTWLFARSTKRGVGEDSLLQTVERPPRDWGSTVLLALSEETPEQRERWAELLRLCLTATGAKPSQKYLKTAHQLIAEIGPVEFEQRFCEWMPALDIRPTNPTTFFSSQNPDDALRIPDAQANLLRGLLWCSVELVRDAKRHLGDDASASQQVDAAEMCRVIRQAAISGFRKLRAIGPRCLKLGNGAVYALGEIGSLDSLAQLAILKGRLKTASARNAVDKALTSTARRLDVTRDELEELSIPDYGLSIAGRRRDEFDGYVAEICVSGKRAELQWFRPDGKPQKSVPASVKQDFADEWKDLKGEIKEIDQMLSTQAARVEQSYLLRRVWPYAVWRKRYLDHPLVGTVARRLIWRVTTSRGSVDVVAGGLDDLTPSDTQVPLVDKDGTRVDRALRAEIERGGSVTVQLWHPLEASSADIGEWRDFLDREQIQQPFKQAHRELYPLTEAERRTETYSNRFAAHILRQHQFHALCEARGWSGKLRLMVDDDYPPPHIELPQWGVRAEFWIESIGDNYGVDTTESGTYLHISTDQVRFYPLEAAENRAHAMGGQYLMYAPDHPENHPLSLDHIPPILFSEIMRDVDLFVGVASVGNDPTWHDGGPEGIYLDYWRNYSFGDLGTSAVTRKEVLEKLIPRLKIASRCSFSDRFLVVRGDIRTYKIHLGSGNILMEPNDQYLCIVPGQSVTTKEKLFLPFEGDSLLSIIISKALLLSEDIKITDRTITSQILA